jgi:hypothetical protein
MTNRPQLANLAAATKEHIAAATQDSAQTKPQDSQEPSGIPKKESASSTKVVRPPFRLKPQPRPDSVKSQNGKHFGFRLPSQFESLIRDWYYLRQVEGRPIRTQEVGMESLETLMMLEGILVPSEELKEKCRAMLKEVE